MPPDSFESRATKTVLCDLLSRAKDSNMNFLRIWGGGIYPQDDFFDCADELGLEDTTGQELDEIEFQDPPRSAVMFSSICIHFAFKYFLPQ